VNSSVEPSLSFAYSNKRTGAPPLHVADFTIDVEAYSTNTFGDCLSDAFIPADDNYRC
jgi:hypothetical protein